MDNEDKNPGFTISSENLDFQNKVHAVFDGINGLKSNLPIEKEKTDLPEVNDKPLKPDFVVNPSRYTKYSLRDTELSDNAANSQIALQFLSQLHQSSNEDSQKSPAVESPFSKKHVFKMPEQPAGVSKPKERKVIKEVESTILSCDKVELDHLEENIAATEFTNEIAQKLEETIKNSIISSQSPDEVVDDGKFKQVNKRKRNLREKPET